MLTGWGARREPTFRMSRGATFRIPRLEPGKVGTAYFICFKLSNGSGMCSFFTTRSTKNLLQRTYARASRPKLRSTLRVGREQIAHGRVRDRRLVVEKGFPLRCHTDRSLGVAVRAPWRWGTSKAGKSGMARSEEHTSELQSHHDL